MEKWRDGDGEMKEKSKYPKWEKDRGFIHLKLSINSPTCDN